MNGITKSKSTKPLSALLAVLMIVAMLPTTAFAWSVEEGTKCTSTYGDHYVSSDGEMFYSKPTTTAIFYNDDGSFYVKTYSSGNAKYKYMMIDGNGNQHHVYCIEGGVSFDYSDTYNSTSGKNSKYFQNLPIAAQYGIMMALMYGYHEGMTSPIPGTNNDDFAFATQCIIWEYQQQLRTSPTSIASNNGIDADMYNHTIKGRPAEQCYNWILEQMSKHYVVPSFSSRNQSNAQTYTMKYDQANDNYSITLTDTNNTLADINFSASGITVTRSGNQYTFTSKNMISNAVMVSAQKKTNLGMSKMLIWGCPGKQTMASGAEDPVFFYLKLNTETYGVGHIVKTSEDGKVEGIKFNISGNGVNETVTTGKNGTVDLDLLPGTYTVTEQTDDKYETQSAQTVTIVSGKTSTVTFNNTLRRGDLKVTKTSEDGLVEGMKFHLYGTSYCGLPVDEYSVTDASGIAVFDDVLIGTGYTLEEVGTPDRYIVPDDQTAAIEWNKVTNKSFDNDLKRGDLKVTKTAEDGLNEGLKFHLYGTSYSGIPVDEYAVTDASGVATFSSILIGTGYTLEEVETPIRYVVPDNQTAAIEWNKVTNKSFDNVLKKWNLTVTKQDVETGSAQGDANLAGAKYGIYKGDELIDTYVTDADGKFTTKYYVCGTDWSIKELDSSEGYLVTPGNEQIGVDPKNYTAEYNSEVMKQYEQVKKGNIAIIKHTDDGQTQIETPEEGAEFAVYLKSAGSYDNAKDSERDYLICDENGFAQTKDLPYGRYTVQQTKGWEGRELLKPFDVFVSENGETYRYLINNANFYSYVKVVKIDSTTGNTIPASGIGFHIYDPSGNQIQMTFTYPTVTTIDTFYTDGDGMLITPEKLEYGKGYSLVEVSAPYGYVLNSDPVYFDITEDNSTEENAVTVVIVEKENAPQMGVINVEKTGEYLASVVDTKDSKRLVYAVGGLAGSEYTVTAAEDIYTLDGTLRYSKDEVVATLVTKEDGKAVTEPLFLGRYHVVETKAPYGMILNPTVRTVELTYAGQEVEITETSTGFYNERQKVEIDLNKVMEQNEVFGVGSNGEITSVNFGLFAAEEIVAADGSSIPAGWVLEVVECDENGYAAFSTDLPVGAKTYIKEISTDKHYVLSDKEYPVVFEYAGQEVATVHIAVNDGNEIPNELIYGTIKGYKVNRETGDKISGALFGLFRADETSFTENNALLTAESGEDGVFTFENVVYGSYTVRELRPAAGYLENETVYAVTVDEDGDVVEITVVNDLIPEIGTTATIDEEKEVCATEVFTLTDTVEYKHLVPGKEYTVKGILMDRATGEPFLQNGEQITSEVTFVPEAPSGSVEVLFTFDAKLIKTDTNIVVFESLYSDSKELTVHADIEDEDQTVTVIVPEIKTEASTDGKKETTIGGEITIEDIVSYHNLTPGKEYVVKGTLMNKTTGKPVTVNDEPVTAEAAFTPETRDGEVKVTFTFNSYVITETTDVVVFESLYREDVEIAVHADIEDEGQSVKVYVPEIKTTASIDGKKEITTAGKVTVEDVVSYTNLIPGTEYTIRGTLMNKATGEVFTVNGETITAEVKFTPKGRNGEVKVKFVFDASGITKSTSLVVFESLYRDDVEITTHKDIEDKDQTVTITPPPDIPKTGDTTNIPLWGALTGISLLGAGVVAFFTFRKKKEENEHER